MEAKIHTFIRIRAIATAQGFTIPHAFVKAYDLKRGDPLYVTIYYDDGAYPFMLRAAKSNGVEMHTTIPKWFLEKFNIKNGEMVEVDIEMLTAGRPIKVFSKIIKIGGENTYGISIPKGFTKMNKIRAGDLIIVKVIEKGKVYPLTLKTVKKGTPDTLRVVLPKWFLREIKKEYGDALMVELEVIE